MISRSMLENTFFYYFCGNLWETDIYRLCRSKKFFNWLHKQQCLKQRRIICAWGSHVSTGSLFFGYSEEYEFSQ